MEQRIRDADRIIAVETSGLVGLSNDNAFDRLLELACSRHRRTEGGYRTVDAEKPTAISGSGFPEGLPLFAPIGFSFCRFVVGHGQPFLVEDALNESSNDR